MMVDTAMALYENQTERELNAIQEKNLPEPAGTRIYHVNLSQLTCIVFFPTNITYTYCPYMYCPYMYCPFSYEYNLWWWYIN